MTTLIVSLAPIAMAPRPNRPLWDVMPVFSRKALEEIYGDIAYRCTEVYDDGIRHPDGTWEPGDHRHRLVPEQIITIR